MTHQSYKERVCRLLANGKTWKDGVWKRDGKRTELAHILPLENEENNAKNRAKAIKKFLGFDCTPYFPKGFKGLHQYAHHLNSSQILCLMFFSKLVDENMHATKEMVRFIKEALGIDIHVGAQCEFEYKEEKKSPYLFDVDKAGNVIAGYEGTSFDFHIQDGDVEVYFEIKFTEDGFNNEKADGRHEIKAAKYLEIAPEFMKHLTPEQFLDQYQIYRNLVRAKEPNKHVVFITDENNPATKRDIELIEKNFSLPQNVMFKTWQELTEKYPFELPFQLKAMKAFPTEKA